MSRRLSVAFACALLGALCSWEPAEGGSPAAQQYAFAQQLAQSGEARFAILEFRRFLFHYPKEPLAADARLALARVYLQHTDDVAACRRELGVVAQQHPKSQAAARARQLDALIEANKEFGYQPLRLLFGAAGARDRGDAQGALRRLGELVTKFPTARLAPDATLMRAQMLAGQKKLDDAIAAYAELPARYPNSPLVAQAHLGQATATEARDGAKPHVAQLYRQVVARYPRSPEAAEAQKRLTALEARLDNIPRLYRRQDIKPFKLTRAGYFAAPTRYDVHLEVSDGLTEHQLKATLEDALIRHAASRKDRTHAVRIEAYLPQGGRRVAVAKWGPRQRPDYEIERVRSKDIWRDILRDVLK